MVYDQQPWIDYFRKLDDDILVAMIDMKGKPIDTGFLCCAAKAALSRAQHAMCCPRTCESGLDCGVDPLSSLLHRPQRRGRRSRLRTLPAAVRGNESVRTIFVGSLCGANPVEDA
jgi:hypothetical protein